MKLSDDPDPPLKTAAATFGGGFQLTMQMN
jgi:hypothetical protein